MIVQRIASDGSTAGYSAASCGLLGDGKEPRDKTSVKSEVLYFNNKRFSQNCGFFYVVVPLPLKYMFLVLKN